jgi:lipopolysaccharide export system protein LptA
MIRKMAGMVAFLVLSCILAPAQESHDKPVLKKPIGPLSSGPVYKEPIGPLIWGPTYKLGADKTYLSFGLGLDQPIDITSKQVSFRNIHNDKKVIFEGNVKMKQGDVTLTCNRLVIVYDEQTGERIRTLPKGLENASAIKSITASGNVKIVQNERMVIADDVLYDNGQRTIILKGNPALLRDGPALMDGSQIIINRGENSKGPIVEPIREKK